MEATQSYKAANVDFAVATRYISTKKLLTKCLCCFAVDPTSHERSECQWGLDYRPSIGQAIDRTRTSFFAKVGDKPRWDGTEVCLAEPSLGRISRAFLSDWDLNLYIGPVVG